METAFNSKVQDILNGNTKVLATSDSLPNVTYPTAQKSLPGEGAVLAVGFHTTLGALVGGLYGASRIAWKEGMMDIHGRRIPYTPFKERINGIARPACFFGFTQFTYFATEYTLASLRFKKDPLNAVAAGMFTGFTVGMLSQKRIDIAFVAGLASAIVAGIFDFNGPTFRYGGMDPVSPANRRRPVTFEESDELKAMKELYPQYKNL